jgi:hypothetical protein
MPPKLNKKLKVDIEKAFPKVALDLSKPTNKGSMSWTSELITAFLTIWVEDVKKKGHTQDAGTFTALGWNIGAFKFNSKFGTCKERNWDNKTLISKLKTKLQELVFLSLFSFICTIIEKEV